MDRDHTLRLLLTVALAVLAACATPTTSSGGGVLLPDGARGNGGKDGVDGNGNGGAGDAHADGAGLGDGANAGDVAAQVCVAAGKGQCDTAAECGSEQYCDPCERVCRAPRLLCDPCQSDVQCEKAEFGSACIAYASGGTYCGRACLADAGCPGSAYTCKTVPGVKAQQCVPKVGSCGPVAGACTADSDCPFTTVCNKDYGACIKGCAADVECPSGKLCSLFRCVAPCTTDGDCAALSSEAKCDAGHCKIPGGCLGPPDCPEKATYCDLDLHKCKAGCKTDFDCKEYGKKCEVNACVAKGCKENWECAFGEVCDPPSGKCNKAEGPYCAACKPDDDTVADCGGKPNKCFSFQDDAGAKLGDYCGLVCSEAASGACPQGYACQEIKDQDGNSQGKFCLRQCWISPFPDGEGAKP